MSQIPLHCKVEPILVKRIHGDDRCSPVVSKQVQTGEDGEQQPYKPREEEGEEKGEGEEG